jgi:hypothetical protein
MPSPCSQYNAVWYGAEVGTGKPSATLGLAEPVEGDKLHGLLYDARPALALP